VLMMLAFFRWWYGPGWSGQLLAVFARIDRLSDSYSFSLLIKTLFSPYRQISAGMVRGPLSLRMRAWADRQISRFIGAGIRIAVLTAGVIVVTCTTILGLFVFLLWPIIPLVPIISAVLVATGIIKI
jgi:hypothetical protein